MKYDFAAIEKKWQDKWEQEKPYAAVTGDPRPKFYGLIEFPYPSAAGLHVVSAVVIVRCIRNISCISDIFPVGKEFADGISGNVIVGLFMLVTVLAAFFDVCRAAAV